MIGQSFLDEAHACHCQTCWRYAKLWFMTANHGETANSLPQYAGRVPVDSFSNRLVLARRLAGMTIEQAAEAADLSKSSWANWENGRRPQDRLEVCRAIADALDVDFDWLVFGGPLLPARGRMTRRVSRASTWNRPTSGGPGQGTSRPMAGRPKGRTDQLRPISAPPAAIRANYVQPARAGDSVNAA